MTSEDELRDLLASENITHGIDPKRVIARSRARRLPKQLGAGAIGTLAVVGLTVGGLQLAQPQQATDSAITMESGAAPEAEDSQLYSDEAKRPSALDINRCGEPLAEYASSAYGLVLSVTAPSTAAVTDQSVPVAVTLTNSGQERVVGTAGPFPAITLAQDGSTVWHTVVVDLPAPFPVDLAPGASMEIPGGFVQPQRCETGRDDQIQSGGLPPLAPGEYQVTAALDFLPDASMPQLATPGLDLVTGPPATIVLQP